MDPYSVFAWIVFYLVIVTLFYWCFRQSMSAVSSDSSANRTTPQSETNNQRPNNRVADHNIYTVTDETHRTSDASGHIQPPPEYKWEDLPPSYEEAIGGSHVNEAFDQRESSTSAGADIELSSTVPSQLA